MAKPIKWNLDVFKDVRKSPEVEAALQDVVDALLEQTGEDLYAGEVSAGKTRSRGTVWTKGTHAERSNAKHNTLVKALANVHVGGA
jgi:hypothetical protein